MLQILVERSIDSAILRCFGRIVAGNEAHVLKDAVVCQGDKRVVTLDLAGVDIIDAGGLGVFVFLHRLGYMVGFELQLANPTDRVRDLLELTRLDSVFTIFSDQVQFALPQDAAGMVA
jgi:anti-sigma B factor antagonist